MSCENTFGETIYSYSRTQAIEDGVLVDLSQANSIRRYWKHPFACTSAVWAIIEEALQQPSQDVLEVLQTAPLVRRPSRVYWFRSPFRFRHRFCD